MAHVSRHDVYGQLYSTEDTKRGIKDIKHKPGLSIVSSATAQPRNELEQARGSHKLKNAKA